MADLLAARTKVIERHKTLEGVAGSGWHPDDSDSLTRARRKELPLSERPVAFLDDDRVKIVGDCAAFVLKKLNEYLALGEPGAGADALDRQAFKAAGRVVAAAGDDAIDVGTQEWNALSHALAAVSVQVVTTGVPD